MGEETSGATNRAGLERIALELVGTTEKASRRVRYVLMVIVTASIIAFSSFWNALNFGWKNQRLELLSALSHSLNRDPELYTKIMEGDEKGSLDGYIDNEFRKKIINNRSIKNVDDFLNDLKNAIKYYRPETLGEGGVKELLKNSRTREEESVKTIKIPFFNIGFDINDLGFIGGFSFLILTLILYYSLKREYENLNIVYCFIVKNFDNKDRIKYYYLMSMNQLLSSPQLPYEEAGSSSQKRISEDSLLKKSPKWFLKHFSKVLFFLPFVLSLMIFIYDCQSVTIGMTISKFSTLVTVIGEFIFTFLILICTLMCIFFTVKLDQKWDEIRAEVTASLKNSKK